MIASHRYGTSGLAVAEFPTRWHVQKCNSIPQILHSQEMLVGQNEFAIDKVGYDDPFFAYDERDVETGRIAP